MTISSKEFQDPGGQVKGVADYANYKVCRLALQHNKVEEAATQIQTHLWHFRQIPAGDTPHQHWGWLSRQHVVFAQLIAHYSSFNLPTTDSRLWSGTRHVQCIHEESSQISLTQTKSSSCLVPSTLHGRVDHFVPENKVAMSVLASPGIGLTPAVQPQEKFVNIRDFSWLRDKQDVLAYAEPLYHYAAAASYAVAHGVRRGTRHLFHWSIGRYDVSQRCKNCQYLLSRLSDLVAFRLRHLSMLGHCRGSVKQTSLRNLNRI